MVDGGTITTGVAIAVDVALGAVGVVLAGVGDGGDAVGVEVTAGLPPVSGVAGSGKLHLPGPRKVWLIADAVKRAAVAPACSMPVVSVDSSQWRLIQASPCVAPVIGTTERSTRPQSLVLDST